MTVPASLAASLAGTWLACTLRSWVSSCGWTFGDELQTLILRSLHERQALAVLGAAGERVSIDEVRFLLRSIGETDIIVTQLSVRVLEARECRTCGVGSYL